MQHDKRVLYMLRLAKRAGLLITDDRTTGALGEARRGVHRSKNIVSANDACDVARAYACRRNKVRLKLRTRASRRMTSLI